MLSEQPLRSSLQVAPLAIQKTKSDSFDDGSETTSTDYYSQAEMTPPTTPNGSQEDLNAPPSSGPVFHNFLRAFYPYNPDYVMTDSTVTLPLSEGDVILVHSIHTNGWADGTLLVSGARGWLPTNYCEAYDPEEMRNLLKALLNFWDLMRSTSVNDTEIFGNQEFMKGLIGGVRYLLERTHCLTRESPLVQRHDGLRRCRKSLLSELSLLVKTSKRLQEAQKLTDADEEINDVIDEMILKAFKIVTKGVKFLKQIENERQSRMPAVAIMTTVMEEAYVPPTPPAESTTFGSVQVEVSDAGSRVDENGDAAEPAPSDTSEAAQESAPANKRLSSVYQAGTNVRRLSQNTPLQVNRLSSTISHRLSLAGPPSLSRSQNLVSERLNSCHDIFLSHLGSFIGRLQIQSQSRPHLALAIKQSASSGGELLVVVDIVCAHNSVGLEALDHSRAAMYDHIQDLMRTARDILTSTGPDMEDMIVPQDNCRLLGAATSCVKATGECVAKTKWVIERIGDFEFEFNGGKPTFDLDLSALDFMQEEKRRSDGGESASIAESSVSEAPTTSTAVSATSSAVSRPVALTMDKPLPDVPSITSPVMEESLPGTRSSSPVSRPQALIDDNASSMVSSVASLRPALPPLPRISTTLLPTEDYSTIEQSASHDNEFHSFRTESMTACSSGSASTYLSRDSESSIVSETSTRATTPEHTPAPRNQPSLSELSGDESVAESSTESMTQAEEVEDVESKLLEKTYAHELMFNKEGQVTGGSLAALVERLTTHESTPDAVFVSTFYLTFRLFCTPIKLAETLIDRFEYVGEAPHMSRPVRLRTSNVFKGWLESHWRQEHDHEALPLIRHFAEFKLASVLPSASKRLLDLADKVSSNDGSLVPRIVSSMGKASAAASQPLPSMIPPQPNVSRSQANALHNWKIGGVSPLILDFDPLEIARQLTIKQMALFCSIMPEELLGSRWTKSGGIGAPNVKAMSAFTTGLSNLVADTILQFDEIKKRALVIKHWIKISHECAQLHNYDALMAITCALTDTSIKRLKMTWDTVSVKRKAMLKSLQAIVDFNQNYKVLRARLADRPPPCLPFLGMFLTDLTFVDVGNPATKTTDTGLIVVNFDKHSRTAKSIGELQRFQIPYPLAEVPDFQEWLSTQIDRVREKDKAGANTQATHYRKSLLLEPREIQQLRTPIDALSSSTAAMSNGVFGWMRGGNTSQALPAQI
ncbi:ras guanine nucleotide exchange factor domain-containing protein [Apodospora peruviana]|uniref:Ras guanine nucleotide exchange factor domain-containing protein n=1 Tax=Apodospora peruviana TaxID=516989 RepID=A0AAE0HZ17_9PEZI|nr:ras guanine nucleotide exchange factor domain-containing protein [Apodospora peruviana]